MSDRVLLETAALPNLIVIGAMKCGTTSLHRNLGLHPEIAMTRPKEQNFFVRADWQRHLDTYYAAIPTGYPIRGESSPNYTKCDTVRGVPARIAAAVPDVKLIYILRDPVQRTVSHWVQFFASGVETRSLADALADLDENPLIDASLYHKQLSAYLEHFDADRIHLMTLEQLAADPTGTMAALFRFLGVDDRFDSTLFTEIRHPGSRNRRATVVGRLGRRLLGRDRIKKLQRRAPLLEPWLRRDPLDKPEVDGVLRARLADRFRQDVAKLRATTGHAFADWSV